MQLTKAEAHQEALRRWFLRPDEERASFADAEAFALELTPQLQFHSMMDCGTLIRAWLVSEVGRGIRVTSRPAAEAA